MFLPSRPGNATIDRRSRKTRFFQLKWVRLKKTVEGTRLHVARAKNHSLLNLPYDILEQIFIHVGYEGSKGLRLVQTSFLFYEEDC